MVSSSSRNILHSTENLREASTVGTTENKPSPKSTLVRNQSYPVLNCISTPGNFSSLGSLKRQSSISHIAHSTTRT